MAGAADSGRVAFTFPITFRGVWARAVPGCRTVYGMRTGRRPGGVFPILRSQAQNGGSFQQLPFPFWLSAWLNSSLATIVAARQTSHQGRQQKEKGSCWKYHHFVIPLLEEAPLLPGPPGTNPYTTHIPQATGVPGWEGLKAQKVVR